jgi:hypothetical protein
MRRSILAFLTVVALTGCSSNGTSSTPGPMPSGTAGSPTPSVSPPGWTAPLTTNAYHPDIRPAQFTDRVTDPYFPLVPGTVMIYQGTRDGKPLHIELTVTHDTKVILGVRCVVVRDIVTGALEERTSDWYAQDASGNVWYFGEDTKEYTNGVVSSTAGTWEAGVDGAQPGIIMLAHPRSGDAYRQEYRPTVAEDVARVTSVGAKVSIPAGHYGKVLVTNDRDLLDLSKNEYKYFAPGVGTIKISGLVNGHHEQVWLTSVLTGK